jgi:hypothetical protein
MNNNLRLPKEKKWQKKRKNIKQKRSINIETIKIWRTQKFWERYSQISQKSSNKLNKIK